MTEHETLRAHLRSLGNTYQYTQAPLADRIYQPVSLVVVRRVVIEEPINRPSALAFAFSSATSPAPEPTLPPPAPFNRPTLPFTPRPTTPTPAPYRPTGARPDALRVDPARLLATGLNARGHKLLTRDGKLFVSEASKLTAEDRERIKTHRTALISMATTWIDTTVTTLGQFLGNTPVRPEYKWVAQEPPSLDGIDTIILNFETNGLKWASGDHPIGVAIGTIDGKLKRYLPWGHEGGNLDQETVIRWLQREVRGKHIINANTRFDIHMGRTIGVDLEAQGNTVSDIQHTAALLDDRRRRFALDILAEDYLGGIKIERVDESRMASYHAAEVAARAEYQVELVAQLRNVMYPEIEKQDLRKVHDLEDQVIYPVVEMEKNGAPIDMTLLEEYGRECMKRHDDLLWEIAKETGITFDHTPTSWRQLFERYRLPISKLKTQRDTFADAIVAKVEHPIIRKARLAGQYVSLNNKIFKPYREMIGSDGILRFDLHQLRGEDGGTITGRFSAGFIQQVPNHGNHHATFGDDLFPRRLYIPGPDAVSYLAADAAQIQYRIFAHHANNPRIMKMYADDPRASFHRMMEGFIRPFKQDILYEHIKNINFMKIFGGGLTKIALMMDHITAQEYEEINNIKVNADRWRDPRLARAVEVQQIYDREVPEIGEMLEKAAHIAMDKCDDRCNRTASSRDLHKRYSHHGYVRTLLGRRVRFPDNFKLYKAFCMVDQGTEGDIVKTKIVELHKQRKEIGFRMRMTVHDEICGDALAPDTMTRVDEILNRQTFPQLRVPILWDTHVGRDWAACK